MAPKARLWELLLPRTSYLAFKKKITRHTEKEKECLKRSTQIRLTYGRMSELSGWEFKAAIINMLRALTKKVDEMKEKMNTMGKEIKILRKNYKIMVEIKTTNRNEE